MASEERREAILSCLQSASEAVSASTLAGQMGVSRQVVVGDVALLRARGYDILSTARGYLLLKPSSTGKYTGKLACIHTADGTREELLAIVDLGGEVVDVAVEHRLYGEITGQLNLSCRQDVELFCQKLQSNEAKLLSELTGGVHLHTVACRDAAQYAQIESELKRLGFLFQG